MARGRAGRRGGRRGYAGGGERTTRASAALRSALSRGRRRRAARPLLRPAPRRSSATRSEAGEKREEEEMGGRAMAVAADSNSREFGGGCCVVRLLLRAALQEQVVHLCGRAAYRQRAAGWRGAAGAGDERESARGNEKGLAASAGGLERPSVPRKFFFVDLSTSRGSRGGYPLAALGQFYDSMECVCVCV